jgi:hypothetical protein
MTNPEKRLRTAARSHVPYLLLIALSCLWTLPASAAPKTDTVYFKNGDKLTGEIKGLRRGELSLNTDATGTIGIEWEKIAAVVSNQNIQIETTSGVRYFGHLATSNEASELIVVTKAGPRTLDAMRVITMDPIDGEGIHALDVDVSIGYNFAKAGGIAVGNAGLNADWRSLIRVESLRFSTTTTASDSESDGDQSSKRVALALQHTRLWQNRWFSNGGLSFDRNDELGLNLRTSLSGGGGRFLIQSNTMLWSLDAGLQVSREDMDADDGDTDSLEATFRSKFDWFVFHDPEFDWSSTIEIIPSLTESGRVRGEIDTTLKWELIGDLDWGLSFYASFDSQPAETGSTSDYGVNTSLTYEF